MDALENIFTRHSVPKVRPDPVPHELIEKLLAAAVQAPNHFRIRPWLFIVLTGEARTRLGEVMAQSYQKRNPDSLESELNRERARPLRAPVLIIVAAEKADAPKVIELGEFLSSVGSRGKHSAGSQCVGSGCDVAHWRLGL